MLYHSTHAPSDAMASIRTTNIKICAAMAQVAEAGAGVVLLLGHQPGGEQILANLREEPKTPSTYSTVGAGSQILRDLGVRKMRLMSSPMKFNAISGFDLEVVEYVPAE